jgi:HlyD family secretion protein
VSLIARIPPSQPPEADAASAANAEPAVSRAAAGAQRRRVRWLRRVLAIAVVAAGIATLRLTLLAPAPLGVRTALVSRGSVEETVSNTRAGTVKARRRARLSPETGGRVVALPQRAGARVAAGALLLRLDAAMQKAQLDLAREDVRAARARVDESCLAAGLAEKELARLAELRASQIASAQMVERAESERDRSRAACRAAAAQLDQARAQTRVMTADNARTQLRSPFAGVIAEVNTELGEWITPAPPGIPIPPVVEVIDPSSLYVTAPIDEMDAERVKTGLEVRLSVDSRRGERFAGRLVRVAPYVQDVVQQNRTIEIEAEFEPGQLTAQPLPGTSADVEVVLSRRNDVLQVPTAAIAQGTSVLVVENGRLVERKVQPGYTNWRATEIRDGLREGEQVVTVRDSPEIKAGAHVVVLPAGEAGKP